MVAHGKKDLNRRILKLVRITTSFAVICAFCIDMNSFKYAEHGITDEELAALQSGSDVDSFSQREKLAIKYARYISTAPLYFPKECIDELKENFSEREIVILVGTAAQVNYWARLIQALGIPPAGFLDQCEISGRKENADKQVNG
jgi:alkylhydroperoxidase family enzyme